MYKLFSKINKEYNLPGIYYIQIKNHSYIGSSCNIKRRLQEHKKKLKNNYHNNIVFQRCYDKYKDEIEIEYKILEICQISQLLDREKYWINCLKPDINIVQDPTLTDTVCLYNNSNSSKEVHQYTLDGEYVASYPSVNEAERQTKCKQISSAANPNLTTNKSIGGYQWSYEKVNKMETYVNNSNLSKIVSVTLYDFDGIKIQTFNSIADSARWIILKDGIGNYTFESICSTISSVCNKHGKLIGSKYRASYDDVENLGKLVYNIKPSKYQVVQEFPDGTIKIWNSVKEALETLGYSEQGIRRVITGLRLTYKKCKWYKR